MKNLPLVPLGPCRPADLYEILEGPDYNLSQYEAFNIVHRDGSDDLKLEYFFAACRRCKSPKLVANWMLNDLLSVLNELKVNFSQCPIKPHYLGGFIRLIEQGRINHKQAKEVFVEMLKGRAASQVVKEKKFIQITDPSKLKELCLRVIADNPKPVADYKTGNKAPLNSLKGQIMKLSGGQANLAVATQILEKLLNEKI